MNQLNQENVFSCGTELADVVLASGLLQPSLAAIKELNETISSSPLSLAYKICESDEKKSQIIALGVGVGGLSSELSPILEQNPPEFKFLQIKNDPFSINKEALTLFRSLLQDENLLQLVKNPTKPLIITGHSIGGWVASLFCLWMLNNIKQSNPNLPICITFGSPLLGDDGLCKAIHSRSGWNPRFLHVVSYGDPIPRTFLSSTENIYKLFGTFLICSSSSSACVCFNDPASILTVLEATGGGSSQIPNLVDYEKLLEDLTHQMIVSKGVSQLLGSRGDPLRAGIILQLDSIGVERNQNNEEDTLITDMEKRERKDYHDRLKHFESDKKLNELKINMAHLEWYKKISSSPELAMGYYDCYKNKPFQRDIHVVKYKKGLTKYWEEVVTEAETKPQKKGGPLPMRVLHAGTNYRRMVEPLDIAEHYKRSKTDYKRAKHLELLERWHEEQESSEGHQRKPGTRAATLTMDSRFWEKVEKAVILIKSLKNKEPVKEGEELHIEKLNKFEEYVMSLIDELAVSPEIFLKESTFMQWWKEYETIPERNRSSRFANFMENKHYQRYI